MSVELSIFASSGLIYFVLLLFLVLIWSAMYKVMWSSVSVCLPHLIFCRRLSFIGVCYHVDQNLYSTWKWSSHVFYINFLYGSEVYIFNPLTRKSHWFVILLIVTWNWYPLSAPALQVGHENENVPQVLCSLYSCQGCSIEVRPSLLHLISLRDSSPYCHQWYSLYCISILLCWWCMFLGLFLVLQDHGYWFYVFRHVCSYLPVFNTISDQVSNLLIPPNMEVMGFWVACTTDD